jgi:hypothetical protein
MTKTKLAVLTTACLILGGIWLSSYAQQSEVHKKATEGQSQMQMGPEMMQQMMKDMGNNPMMAQCQHMMRTVIYPDSASSILALKEQLDLSEKQTKELIAIQEKANAEAKRVLTEEQGKKFEALTKDWKPQSMMQCMQTMMSQMQKMMGGQMPACPMMQMMQGKERRTK